jgi:hypothetical protein
MMMHPADGLEPLSRDRNDYRQAAHPSSLGYRFPVCEIQTRPKPKWVVKRSCAFGCEQHPKYVGFHTIYVNEALSTYLSYSDLKT